MPLAWAAGSRAPAPYVNLGDALSPVMVALVSGRPVTRAAMAAEAVRPDAGAAARVTARLQARAGAAELDGADRMAAIGTIGQNLRGGHAVLWGTGCSPYAGRPGPAAAGRAPYRPPRGTRLQLAAARGPYAARLLSGGDAPAVPFGDPAVLLPRFHDRPVAPRYALGVVLHLAELADRAHVARPAAGLRRYAGLPPAEDMAPLGPGMAGLTASHASSHAAMRGGQGGAAGDIALITMVTAPDASSIAARIDTLRACRRIVSTSLHGIALAMAYGIPCLYLASGPGRAGPGEAVLDPAGATLPEGINPRFPDLAAGLGLARMPFWRQPKDTWTDWDAVIRAIDAMADPVPAATASAGRLGDDLISACPAGHDGASAPAGRGSRGSRALDDTALVRSLPFMGSPNPAGDDGHVRVSP